jgi:hypothetical protein
LALGFWADSRKYSPYKRASAPNEETTMAKVLFEKVVNPHGVTWIRSYGIDGEHFALCSQALYPGVENITEGEGQITCPDCVNVIQLCKEIDSDDLAPEYNNELFHRRLTR